MNPPKMYRSKQIVRYTTDLTGFLKVSIIFPSCCSKQSYTELYTIYIYAYIISDLYIYDIYHIVSISIYIDHIYSSLQPAPSLIPLPTAGRSFFFPLVDGWIILPRFGRFLHCKDLRYLNKTVKWIEATQLSSTYPRLEHNKKQMHNLVLVSKTSLMNTNKWESETRYINFQIMSIFGISMFKSRVVSKSLWFGFSTHLSLFCNTRINSRNGVLFT